jgi:hypothetical protein
MKRLISIPITGEQQLAQGLITNQIDFSNGPQPLTFDTIFKGNPKITTWTGRDTRSATPTGSRPRSTSTTP